MMKTNNNILSGRIWKVAMLMCVSIAFHFPLSTFHSLKAQAPGTTPVKVSFETQMLHGRKYYVHIVETGQTVYSISRAYKVESYDAVTHVDIHFLHAGDTVWLPVRGQFTEEEKAQASSNPSNLSNPTPTSHTNPTTPTAPVSSAVAPPKPVRKVGKTLKVGLMMPLHLDQIDQISTSKFDIEQRGKKSYRQFEFIEFYEGLLLALDQLAAQGVSVELNVADVSGNTPAQVEEVWNSYHMDQSDFVVALLLRECFDRAALLAHQAGVYIVNPMATRSELCADNPYMVKIQPSLQGMISLMLSNMKAERPDAHLYIIHSGSKAEKAALDEFKRQLTERGDIKYTLFNWSQSARLVSVLKATPNCNVVSIYEQGKDNNRVHSINLLNQLSSIKRNSPTLYTLTDWTREYGDIDFAQLQLLGYHTYSLAWDMTNDVHVQFLQAFRSLFGSEPTSQLAATAYDLMLYVGGGLAQRGGDFWLSPTLSQSTLVHPLHLSRTGAGLENDCAQLYRLEELRFTKALFK